MLSLSSSSRVAASRVASRAPRSCVWPIQRARVQALKSIDPLEAETGPYKPGKVFHVHNPEDLASFLDQSGPYKGRLVVLMCKASHCRYAGSSVGCKHFCTLSCTFWGLGMQCWRANWRRKGVQWAINAVLARADACMRTRRTSMTASPQPPSPHAHTCTHAHAYTLHIHRPCKSFAFKYHQLAERFSDCVLLDITGDESKESRKMMVCVHMCMPMCMPVGGSACVMHACACGGRCVCVCAYARACAHMHVLGGDTQC